MTTGIIVFAHGSRIEPANEAVRAVAADLARAGDYPIVEAAFLELGWPSLEEAADLLAAQGVERIAVIPYFLTPGTHLERDLPALIVVSLTNIKTYRSSPRLRWTATPDLYRFWPTVPAPPLVEPYTLNLNLTTTH